MCRIALSRLICWEVRHCTLCDRNRVVRTRLPPPRSPTTESQGQTSSKHAQIAAILRVLTRNRAGKMSPRSPTLAIDWTFSGPQFRGQVSRMKQRMDFDREPKLQRMQFISQNILISNSRDVRRISESMITMITRVFLGI